MTKEIGAIQVVSLRELRKMLGKTQKDVARAMGVSQGEISRMERRSNMRVSTVMRFMQALGIPYKITANFPDKEYKLYGTMP